MDPLRTEMQSQAIIAGPTLCEHTVDQDLVRLTGCELFSGIQWPPVQAMKARALLRQQEVWEVAIEEHLHIAAQCARVHMSCLSGIPPGNLVVGWLVVRALQQHSHMKAVAATALACLLHCYGWAVQWHLQGCLPANAFCLKLCV